MDDARYGAAKNQNVQWYSFIQNDRPTIRLTDYAPHASVVEVEIKKKLYGVQNYLQDIPDGKIGVALAGNSGLPGGAVGLAFRVKSNSTIKRKDLEDKRYSTQEEDVVKDWMLTMLHYNQSLDTTMDQIWGKFGLLDHNPRSAGATDPNVNKQTHQGVDFTNLYESKWTKQLLDNNQPLEKMYADALVVRSAFLAPIKNSNGEYNFKESKKVDLVFVAGPNVGTGPRKDAFSSTNRTYNHYLQDHYCNFREGVFWAFYAALYAMAMENCRHACLPWISGDLYAGDFKATFGVGSDGKEIKRIVTDVLAMKCTYSRHGNIEEETRLGQLFDSVVIVTLARAR